MSGLTRTPLTDGTVQFAVRVPADRADHVQAAIADILRRADAPEQERTYSIEEVFPDMGPSDALRGARGLREMTQAWLAAAVGVRPSHISDMENGRRPIGKEMAKKLGKALDMPWKVFL